MNLLTALIIKTRGKDVKCSAGGPDNKGKYTGWIELYKKGEFDHALLNTDSVFNSQKEAINEMKKIVKEVRKMKL